MTTGHTSRRLRAWILAGALGATAHLAIGCGSHQIPGAPLGSFLNEDSLGTSPDVVKPAPGHTFQNPRG